jgi:hypothetical protein
LSGLETCLSGLETRMFEWTGDMVEWTGDMFDRQQHALPAFTFSIKRLNYTVLSGRIARRVNSRQRLPCLRPPQQSCH